MIDRLAIGFIAAIVIVGGAWWHGQSTASSKCDADKLRTELADTRVQLETLQRVVTEQADIIQSDAGKARETQEALDRLKSENADLVASMTDGECLNADEWEPIRKRLEGAR